ncbi:MAG TPA: hypothetical protein VEA99_01205 [Gemmatimonadaceae bacterium]|nr:hypothetical protein [Gemmatimonadaceae bacterium]
MQLRRFFLPLALAALSACASGGSTTATPRRSADLITAEELAQTDTPNLLYAVQRLRPNWLRSRGQVSINTPGAGEPVVYIDDTRLGAIGTLEQIIPSEVREVRRLNAAEATNRYGTGHAGGAIVVRRRVGG